MHYNVCMKYSQNTCDFMGLSHHRTTDNLNGNNETRWYNDNAYHCQYSCIARKAQSFNQVTVSKILGPMKDGFEITLAIRNKD